MGNIVEGYLGSKSGSKAAKQAAATAAKYAEPVYFKPYSMVSSYGATSYDPETGSYTTGLTQPYSDALASSIGGAGSLFDQISQFSPAQRQQEIFQEQAALLQPEFQKQATQLQSSLFGTGRLGMRLAGEGVGAGSGMVQPDAFGLAQAQQQTLGNLLAGSRQQALEEVGTLGDVGAKMLTSGLGISELENQLTSLGIDAETARAVAAGTAGQIGTTALADIMGQRYAAGKQKAGSIGTAISAGLKLFPSDENLKTDIKKVGELDNGLGIYTWKWNAKAKELGVDNAPEVGVIAQEVQKVIPNAVHNMNGYLAVNYSMVLG